MFSAYCCPKASAGPHLPLVFQEKGWKGNSGWKSGQKDHISWSWGEKNFLYKMMQNFLFSNEETMRTNITESHMSLYIIKLEVGFRWQ